MTATPPLTTNDPLNSTADKLDTGQLYHRAGDLMKAEDLYREVLHEDPVNAEAYHLLGLIGLQSGKYPAAQELLLAATELDDSKALYHANLAATFYVQTEYEQAEAEYGRAVELDPKYDEAWLNLGIILKHQEKFEDAITPLDNAVQLRPGDPKPFALLAECLLRIGDEDQAEEFLRAAANLGPSDEGSLMSIINTLEGLNRPREAIRYARLLTERDTTNSRFYHKLASLCSEAGLSEQAEQSARRALHLDPDNPASYQQLSQALMSCTNWDKALETNQIALEKFPEHQSLQIQQASILERKGRIKEAYQLIRPIFAEQPSYPLNALNTFTSIARKYGAAREAANMLAAPMARQDLPRSSRQSICFQAGRLFDDVGEHDRAFEAYAEGNQLKPRKYDREKEENRFQVTEQTFTKDFLERATRASHGSRRPIFIVGMPRSGTSLTEQILASHPEVYGAGELSTLQSVSRFLGDYYQHQPPYPHCLENLTEDVANRAAGIYLDWLLELDPEANRVTDKMPHNFMFVGLITLLFPEAKIIHTKRDGRDTCLSCYFQNFSAAGLSFAYDLDDLGHQYRLYDKLMQHWREVLPGRIYESQYEDLTTDPETHVPRLLEFCELDWHDNCLKFHQTKRDTKTASYDQVREPMYTKSVGRWRKYEKHIEPLVTALGDVKLVDPQDYLPSA